MKSLSNWMVLVVAIAFSLLAGCSGNHNWSNLSPATYAVTYDGNGSTGGSVPADSGQYQQGQVVTVLGNSGSLSKTGSAFSGWNTQADGAGTTYAQGQTFSIGSANVTLYAKWSPLPTYTVTYNGNGSTGGTAPADAVRYLQAQTVTVLGNAGNLVNAGYTFSGWNTQAGGGGTTYTQGQTFSMGSANVVLYAKWSSLPTFTVTYDGNGSTGGTAPTDAVHYLQAQTVTVLDNSGNLVKTGSTFSGWNTQANGSGTTYTPGLTFSMSSANVVLYAQWTSQATYTVTYDGNGSTSGSAPTDGIHYLAGQTFTVPGNTGNLVKTGNTFSGWNTQADGGGITYSQGQTFTLGSTNVLLYAKWQAPAVAVYVAGDWNTVSGPAIATYWINDVSSRHVLGVLGDISEAHSIYVSGGTVYTAGLYAQKACYWVGDSTTPVILGAAGTSGADAIWVDSGKIYIGGMDNNMACYWVDDGTGPIKTSLASTGSETSSVRSMFISGGNLYFSGWFYDPAPSSGWIKACYWMNDAAGLHILSTDAQHDVIAYGIAVDGAGTIFTAGSSLFSGLAYVWTNGLLTLTGAQNSYFYGISVDGSDVYLAGNTFDNAGSVYRACYWKNGVLNYFEPTRTGAVARAISVKAGNIYAAGSYNSAACLWVNGTFYGLSQSVYGAKGIFVTGP